jgi:hypothetical protein
MTAAVGPRWSNGWLRQPLTGSARVTCFIFLTPRQDGHEPSG